MWSFCARLIATALLLVAIDSVAIAACVGDAGSLPNPSNEEVADRDKTGTNATLKNSANTQIVSGPTVASNGSFEAEGKGFYPLLIATPGLLSHLHLSALATTS